MKTFSAYFFVLLTFLLASCRPDHKLSDNNNPGTTTSSITNDSSENIPGWAECHNYHNKNCNRDVMGGWLYNAQSRSGLFMPGATSRIRCVIYKGMDYRMSVCGESGTQIQFKLYDSGTNELLFDNATTAYERTFEFTSTSTRQLTAEIKLNSVPTGITESCIGFLILHKLTEK